MQAVVGDVAVVDFGYEVQGTLLMSEEEPRAAFGLVRGLFVGAFSRGLKAFQGVLRAVLRPLRAFRVQGCLGL